MKEKSIEERIENWYREHSDKLKIEEEKMNNMTSSEDYINWLCNYLKDNHYFYDEDWMYFPDTMAKEDRINASKICLLYQIVDKYAISKGINPEKCKFGNYYRVSYYDFGFDIGARIDAGIMFFCNEDLDQNKKFIDFNEILDIKRESKDLIKK